MDWGGHILKASDAPMKQSSVLNEQCRGSPLLYTSVVLAVVKIQVGRSSQGPPLPEGLQAVSACWKRQRDGAGGELLMGL